MATVLCAKFRRYAAPLFALAALIGVSRVYMGVHYASDVIAGALIGIAIGYVLVKVSGRILSPQSALRPRSLIG
jgi:undecaprenyl-diphosphatase